MSPMRALVLILCLMVIFSCKDKGKEGEATSQMEQVMIIHDEVMPEMSTIKRLQKKLRTLPQDSTQLEMITELKKAGDAV